MKTLYLLIILTQNSAGDINASFVNTDTLQQCQQKALMVENVFNVSGIPVIERRCIQSAIQFSGFQHTLTSRNRRKFYLVYFDETTVEISEADDWIACMKKQKNAVKQGRLYCTSSVQSML